MLCWSIICVASVLFLVSLDETICGPIQRTGVHLKPQSGREALAGKLKKTIVDARVGNHGHFSPKTERIPPDQSSLQRKKKPLADMVGANDTVHVPTRVIFPGSKGDSLKRASSFVAFTVNYQGPVQGPYPAIKIVTFNKVITNIGGGFDPMFSVFICKISGYYFFSVSVLGTDTHPAGVNLVHDGRDIAKAYSSPRYIGSAALTAYLHVAAGGRVWISLAIGGAVNKAAYHTFSGALVKPDAAT